MSFKVATLSAKQIKALPPELQEEIKFIKDNTDNFNPMLYDVFADNDRSLYQLAQDALATKVDTKSPVKVEPMKQETPQPSPPKKKEEQVKVTPVKTPPKKEVVIVAKKEMPFSWRRKMPTELLEQAKKTTLDCDFFVITAEQDTTVEIKNTFRKGDKLLVHTDGYPFALITPQAFDKRCAKVVEKKQAIKAPEPVDKAKSQSAVPLLTWLRGQIELWKNRQINHKITKVMAIKETGVIIIEQTTYDKLLRIADLRLSYFKICLETTKLTKAPEPKRGTYRLLVTKQDLQKEYSSNDNWDTCRIWIREAYACAREGNCSEAQKELFKKYYHQCGDQEAKAENIAFLRWRHQEAGKIWKRGEEAYLEAFGRVGR